MKISYVLMMFNYFCLVIFVLIGVAFFTLLERKVLGYVQLRKGPNKVSVGGVLQPFADAVKLFSKSFNVLSGSNYFVYYFSPGMMIVTMLLLWSLYNFLYRGFDFKLGMLFFLCCSSIGVYSLFFSGWASNSKYALLGSLRGVAQAISYEVSMALIILSLIVMVMSFNFIMLVEAQKSVWLIVVLPVWGYVWFVSMLAETNRTPFDFAEGESELVSGFNVEYSGGLFALLFMSEYGSIMFMSYFMSMIYFGSQAMVGMFISGLLVILFIWVRGTLPRFRYDKLMYLAWSSFLPMILNGLVYLNGLFMYFIWF